MGKKLTIYFFAFIVLILLNITLLINLSVQNKKEEAIRKILSEIEEDYNLAKNFNYSNAPFDTSSLPIETKLTDGRAANLKAFFRRHGSPLYDFAELIVQESDKNGFDYRLLPAIAMQESTLCRAIPTESHNCWGWGIYGNSVIRFPTYQDAIKTVAAGIKKEYLDKGLTTASKIMAKYTPSSKGSWAYAVNMFLRDLE
ncbi:hypothetical protein A3C98_00045 [Candidatus Roizmanbacteria bacterium RIFCSPHIGHO2_02_FULL_37_15]|uniref:Mannosyl-glycoprotein endo-beta-N-acetylglucosamidase-like domain-containing protein n=1 Tax=Candidatus Roizmanbacteria bacterium RIFCSPLOWO2_01_FULL_37_16 TaxID=1802058 RepID=A0A1F7IKT0_9BACT|nr:MAG: hypothetical protein A2859_04770 [Candidatus Roizmanbacteria bacterium RIFCSPHIGHO2_01_FULL_37_16b]OGK22270.1 MAG: hypothetical protein A3C98_00045 [Candidatus Roizmanbacteria bacterium RIFCSPHIGHO2_02_FULL_37_15]OGK31783.1 MAG: hypothetical protein A3F57_00370 [Candidatus Roizmanbacteria bacterium RIFCSPHIGHO2_12_FULL_36_11]OGK43943.1 MAG: hypothetical protein A3B40_04005 [Candidatus Roizmanbacteria bacterium RIFCSPLOWO2_01_FULL_37_16]OGK56435.1 MAG: hypothetical protein A3I50_00330 [C